MTDPLQTAVHLIPKLRIVDADLLPPAMGSSRWVTVFQDLIFPPKLVKQIQNKTKMAKKREKKGKIIRIRDKNGDRITRKKGTTEEEPKGVLRAR